jgi:alkylation response protein AidB-like acyl-CoA dehydrogenase
MNSWFSDEQLALREMVSQFLQDKSSSATIRQLMETREGFDRAVWKEMGGMGLQGLHIPEVYGGQGATFLEMGITMEEMGRRLFCGPYFSSVCLAANAILNVGSEDDKGEFLPEIAAGGTVAALAFMEREGKWGADGIGITYQKSQRGFSLSGEKLYVIDGHIADLLVVAARVPGSAGTDGISLFVVTGDAPGLTRTLQTTMDMTRKQSMLELTNVTGRILGDEGAGWEGLSKTLDQAAVCLSMEMVGGAEEVLEQAVSYAKTRMQFGRAIGSFQAIKHRCADMLLLVESGKAAAHHAALVAARDEPDLSEAACVAKAYCSDAYFYCASENVHIHGGSGFTWDADPHLYFRRAKSSALYLGDASYHRELIARRIGM